MINPVPLEGIKENSGAIVNRKIRRVEEMIRGQDLKRPGISHTKKDKA